jgi:phosphoribosylaminoimidazole-succinocarboxamide synthase
MLIDEIHTPDSSRIWLAHTYQQKFENGENPDTFDKEKLRRWLTEKKGFRGEGRVPVVDPEIIENMREAYVTPYTIITGNKLPGVEPYVRDRTDEPLRLEREIRQAVNRFYGRR